jgi:hypothetical protein
MPARSGLLELSLLVVSLVAAPALVASCSSPEQHDAPPETTVPSCEASNTCGTSGGGTLPPIQTTPVVPPACTNIICVDAGAGDGAGGNVVDAPSDAGEPVEAASVVDAGDASKPPSDGGQDAE